ncbi:RREB transcription factor [Perkinsela sp. CCAP 1560/4]|nr:RREB transcription factor [Perkinsela sp. CCAP 1560/4]|eukprot:KNH09689.1 RREB transcription factor [Perkinsela sp. CCAP 1560/4]
MHSAFRNSALAANVFHVDRVFIHSGKNKKYLRLRGSFDPFVVDPCDALNVSKITPYSTITQGLDVKSLYGSSFPVGTLSDPLPENRLPHSQMREDVRYVKYIGEKYQLSAPNVGYFESIDQ